MAKCTKCGADITSTGYDTEELKLPNNVTGYLANSVRRSLESFKR